MIIASLATIPGRERSLKQCVESLLPQVDQVCVYANYDLYHDDAAMPSWWDDLCDRHEDKFCPIWDYYAGDNGDTGDAGKFCCVGEVRGYHIVCDDDLIYAPGYVAKMIESINRYEAIVTLQGRVLHRPLETYYHDREGQTKYRLQDPLEQDVQVDIAGTGCFGYHTDTIRFSLDDFPHRNMADVLASRKCAIENVLIYCIAHTGQEVQLSPYVNHSDGIWGEMHRNDAVQTEIANEIYGLKQKVAA